MKKAVLLIPLLIFLASFAHAGLWESVTNLPGDIANAILDGFKQIVVDFVTPLLDLAKNFITTNPDPMQYQTYWQAILILISAFYLLVFFMVAFKFIVGSYDEVQRAEAKEWAKKAILIVVLCNASLLIYSLILQLGSAAALFMWNSAYEQLFQLQNLSALNFLLLILFAIAVLVALITLFVRYILVIVGIMAFPIGVFLYFIPPLQSYGKIILNTLGITIFLQVIDVLILVASSLLLNDFGNNIQMQLLAPTMGFFLVAAANILLLKFAVNKAASESGTKISITQIVQRVMPSQKNNQTNLGDY
ncbi:MAG: hypothetical protein V1847_01615 [Candidatus Diapherotrites archaeon]